ncbi:hypothetical protein V2J09_004608 [Rumex salicifolius]
MGVKVETMLSPTMSMNVEGTSQEDMIDEGSSRRDESCPDCEINDEKDMEQMKDRFAKLLLGEDMSGGGKGVASALALSNAITNLSASVFADQRRLQPMSPDLKTRWTKEIDWLLSVADFIVEFAPSQQVGKDGTCMEIMTTRQRSDLQMNIRALKKLDFVLLNLFVDHKQHCLDSFKVQNEFYYVSKDPNESKNEAKRKDDKWWIPTVKVPPTGLSETMVQWIQFQKDSVSQVLKAAMAINAQILSKMEIPENYIESLPKNGRSSLGDSIYKSITDQYFDPEQFLSSIDLSSEHKIVDLKNRIEASICIWKRKMNNKDSKSPWGSSVSLEKREIFEERAEADVGHALQESYSRVIESLAHKILSQIEDVLQAHTLAQNPTLKPYRKDPNIPLTMKLPRTRAEIEMSINAIDASCSMTIGDFMGSSNDIEGDELIADDDSDEPARDVDQESLLARIKTQTQRRVSSIERLETGSRSPIVRHI